MIKRVKYILRKSFNFIIRIIGSLFFKKRFLSSKYFYVSSYGANWILKGIFWQKIISDNAQIPWPVSHYNTIVGPYKNIIFDPENIDNFQGKGVYFQCENAKIYIGTNTLIANNVGLITANHNPLDVQNHLEGKDIHIGDNCWIGINAVILPGVCLGNNTIVGAGAIVTKSFEQGNCVIAGNPAKILKSL